MYHIPTLKTLEDNYAAAVLSHFKEFFEGHDYSKPHQRVAVHAVSDVASAGLVYQGIGMYVILTDCDVGANACTFEHGGLTAIYRGHCRTVKERIRSHLFNRHYRENQKGRGVRYDVCMKLGDEDGINIEDELYRCVSWRVLVHKMTGSSELMRQQAEKAFDEVFGRPVASRET